MELLSDTVIDTEFLSTETNTNRQREKLLSPKATRAGTLAYLSRIENEFKSLLASPGAGSEIIVTKTKASFDKALEKAARFCGAVLSACSDLPEFASERDEAWIRQEETTTQGKAIDAFYDNFKQSIVEVSSAVSE